MQNLTLKFTLKTRVCHTCRMYSWKMQRRSFCIKRIKKIIVGTITGQKYEEVHFVDSTKPVWNYSLFTDEDIRNFQEGTHYRVYELMGSHGANVLGTEGYYFAVWA